MFYVLNFASHQFLTCHTIADVVNTVGRSLRSGISRDDIEIVNCFADDSRLTVDEFIAKYAKE